MHGDVARADDKSRYLLAPLDPKLAYIEQGAEQLRRALRWLGPPRPARLPAPARPPRCNRRTAARPRLRSRRRVRCTARGPDREPREPPRQGGAA